MSVKYPVSLCCFKFNKIFLLGIRFSFDRRTNGRILDPDERSSLLGSEGSNLPEAEREKSWNEIEHDDDDEAISQKMVVGR